MRVEINLQHNKIREFKQDFVANNVIIAFFLPPHIRSFLRLLQFPHITRVWILYLKHQNTQRLIKSEPCQYITQTQPPSPISSIMKFALKSEFCYILPFLKSNCLNLSHLRHFPPLDKRLVYDCSKFGGLFEFFFLSRYCHFRRRNQTSQRRH